MQDIYFSVKGRITRKDFWLYWIVPALALSLALYALHAGNTTMDLVCVLLIWPAVAVCTKRLHDLNQSGWWQLVMLIPLAGAITLFAMCGFKRGTLGTNEYGEDPHDDRYPVTSLESQTDRYKKREPLQGYEPESGGDMDSGDLFGRVLLWLFLFVFFLAMYAGFVTADNPNDQGFQYVLLFMDVMVASLAIRLLFGVFTSKSTLGSVLKLVLSAVLGMMLLLLTLCTAFVHIGWHGG